MTKEEAAKFLGVTHRTLERYVSEGKLRISYKKGKTNKIAVFDEEEVKKIKSQIKPRKAKKVSVPLHVKLTLNLEEASGFSGLPMAFLERAIQEGKLKAIDTGSQWNIKRSDLEEFVAGL